MQKIQLVLLAHILGIALLNCVNATAIEENLSKRDIVTIKIAIPKLPSNWRLPTVAELDHIMRPQSVHLYPDYIAQAYIDEDSKAEWILLAVKKDKTQEAILVHLSSSNEWIVLDTDELGENEKIDMTMDVQKCDGETVIFYSALGRPGHTYHWDTAQHDFIKKVEQTEFQ